VTTWKKAVSLKAGGGSSVRRMDALRNKGQGLERQRPRVRLQRVNLVFSKRRKKEKNEGGRDEEARIK